MKVNTNYRAFVLSFQKWIIRIVIEQLITMIRYRIASGHNVCLCKHETIDLSIPYVVWLWPLHPLLIESWQ